MTPETAHSPASGGFRSKSRDGKRSVPDRRTAKTADELLMESRASLPHRPSPAEAHAAQAKGALLIDIRGDDQRRIGGLIPGAILLPRNALEWRCDPAGKWRHPAVASRDQHLILICQEGFQSSLAAAARANLRTAVWALHKAAGDDALTASRTSGGLRPDAVIVDLAGCWRRAAAGDMTAAASARRALPIAGIARHCADATELLRVHDRPGSPS